MANPPGVVRDIILSMFISGLMVTGLTPLANGHHQGKDDGAGHERSIAELQVGSDVVGMAQVDLVLLPENEFRPPVVISAIICIRNIHRSL